MAAATALVTAGTLLLVWRLRAGRQQQGINASQSTIRKLNASSAVDLTFELDKNKSPILLGKGAFGEVSLSCSKLPIASFSLECDHHDGHLWTSEGRLASFMMESTYAKS